MKNRNSFAAFQLSDSSDSDSETLGAVGDDTADEGGVVVTPADEHSSKKRNWSMPYRPWLAVHAVARWRRRTSSDHQGDVIGEEDLVHAEVSRESHNLRSSHPSTSKAALRRMIDPPPDKIESKRRL
jgi:hypothetical protein